MLVSQQGIRSHDLSSLVLPQLGSQLLVPRKERRVLLLDVSLSLNSQLFLSPMPRLLRSREFLAAKEFWT